HDRARLGGRSDQAAITERLLSISGEDALTIDRKHIVAWTGRLPTRYRHLRRPGRPPHCAGAGAKLLRTRGPGFDHPPADRASRTSKLAHGRLSAAARARLLCAAWKRARGHRGPRNASGADLGFHQRTLPLRPRPHGAGRASLPDLEVMV